MVTDGTITAAPAAAAPTPAAAAASAPAAPAPPAASNSGASKPTPSPARAPESPGSAAGGSGAKASGVDPAKYPIREDYAKALLDEKLASIPAEQAAEQAKVEEGETPNQEAREPAEAPEAAQAPGDADQGEPSTTNAAEEQRTAETDDDFQLEPEAPVTPESLTQMAKENEEFAKILDADPKLKGQLYKTAREAAELKPYRELFPDLESAKSAHDNSSTWVDVRETFLGSTTREGTLTALARIAELSYERGANGEVLEQDGQPVIGEDFYGFVDNVVGLDLEHRSAEVEARLRSNMYRSQEERDRDESVKAALEILREETAAPSPAKEDLPESLRRRLEALERGEIELKQRRHGAQVEVRKGFEQGLQQEAQKRISDSIQRILTNVEKQGAMVSPYLKNILPKAIGAKLVRKIQANPALQGQMQELQRLPVGDASRQRRLAAIDRAIQQYLPDVAREELRQAGVQTAASAAAKRAKVDAQIDATKKTEPKGSTGPAGRGGTALGAGAAFDHARSEWQKANPGRPFDNVAKEEILPRVLQLMSSW